jgi:hypothetical protein
MKKATARNPLPSAALGVWEDKLGRAIEWAGRCYELAQAGIKAGLVYGKARYGHWVGPVAEDSMFHGKPVIHHGWVELPDGSVVDPTRWEFEGKLPYIYHGPSDHYDVGGNLLRKQFVKPCYDFDPKAKRLYPLPRAIRPLIPKSKNNIATAEQVFWMANLPVDELLPYALHIIAVRLRK